MTTGTTAAEIYEAAIAAGKADREAAYQAYIAACDTYLGLRRCVGSHHAAAEAAEAGARSEATRKVHIAMRATKADSYREARLAALAAEKAL